MSIKKSELQTLYSLSEKEVEDTLVTCGIPTHFEEYDEDVIQSSFEVIRQYITNGQVDNYQQAIVMFKSIASNTKQTGLERKSKTRKLGTLASSDLGLQELVSQPKTISELLQLTCQKTEVQISLAQAINILHICGLSESSLQYEPPECERFIKACVQILVEGKSPEEVSVFLGTTDSNNSELEMVAENLMEEAIKTGESLEKLVDKITNNQADDIAGLVRRSYLKNVVSKLMSDNSTEQFFAHLEQRVMASIQEKKSLRRSHLSGMGWETKVLAPSSENLSPEPTPSPDVFENGMTTD